MKYLLLLLLCSCEVKVTRTQTYDCSIAGPHGSYATMKVDADSEEEATRTADEVKKRLVDQKLIPDYVMSFCHKEIRNYPKGK